MEAVKICNLFVKNGQEIVTTKGRFASENNRFKTMSAPSDPTIRLAVLINGRSASASEIVSGAPGFRSSCSSSRPLWEIGPKMQILGIIQNKLTTSKYYIPSGRVQALQYSKEKKRNSLSIEIHFINNQRMVFDGNGIEPDVEVMTLTIQIL